jgi:prevent-host-death family protein
MSIFIVMSTVTIANTKAHLSTWIHHAETGEPVMITRHGKPVAALISANELERLRRIEAAAPKRGLLGLHEDPALLDDDFADLLMTMSRNRQPVRPLPCEGGEG